MTEVPGSFSFYLNVTCVVQDEITANQIFEETKQYFSLGHPLPWLSYYEGGLFPYVANLAEVEKTVFDRQREFYRWLNDDPGKLAVQQAIRNAQDMGEQLKFEELMRKFQTMPEDAHSHLSASYTKEEGQVLTRVTYLTASGTIEKTSQQLVFKNMLFSSIGDGLPAFVNWLSSNGCHDIHFTCDYVRW